MIRPFALLLSLLVATTILGACGNKSEDNKNLTKDEELAVVSARADLAKYCNEVVNQLGEPSIEEARSAVDTLIATAREKPDAFVQIENATMRKLLSKEASDLADCDQEGFVERLDRATDTLPVP